MCLSCSPRKATRLTLSGHELLDKCVRIVKSELQPIESDGVCSKILCFGLFPMGVILAESRTDLISSTQSIPFNGGVWDITDCISLRLV